MFDTDVYLHFIFPEYLFLIRLADLNFNISKCQAVAQFRKNKSNKSKTPPESDEVLRFE
jgi:hypothetical protein